MNQKKLNRQAREYSPSGLRPWYDYGDAPLHEAARRHAVAIANEELITDEIFKIEVRCQTYPEIPPQSFKVRVSLVARILDPRGGTDKEKGEGES